MAASTVVNHVADPETKKTPNTRGFDPKFLDYFWKLAETDSSVRLKAVIDIIQCLRYTESFDTQLKYTIGRLVQGLASARKCARNGYFAALIGILNGFSTTVVPNQVFHDAVNARLSPKGSKGEKVEQHVGIVLAYGALLRAGRVSDDEVPQTMSHFLAGSKIKSYILPVAFSFMIELIEHVDKDTFKNKLWPILKDELSLTWDNHSYDTLNFLLTIFDKFPKVVKASYLMKSIGCSKISDPNCFPELTKFILKSGSQSDHPILLRIANTLSESRTILQYWVENFDKAIDLSSKTKTLTTIVFLNSFVKKVDNDLVGKLFTKNVVDVIVSNLKAKEDPSFSHTNLLLDSLKEILTREDISPVAQSMIIENILQLSGHIDFDRFTDTRFVSDASLVLKKDALERVAEFYQQFINESSKTQERVYVIQQIARLINHNAMQHELNWKSSQFIFIARWAFFTPSAVKSFSSAAKEVFFKSLESPCKKLEELSAVLLMIVGEVNVLISISDQPDQVKTLWVELMASVKRIEKRQKTIKKSELWTGQVFLVLLLNMGFESLREPALAADVINELNACYSKATEKRKKSMKAPEEEEPNWLEVVTDILLSLLSQEQHLLRSIVLTVWSLLSSHVTTAALQQVLDVIDPSKKETPLIDAAEESDDSGDDDEEEEEEDSAGEEEDAAAEEDDEDDGADSDGMSDEEETVTDKLRMRIHEALGDSAAVSDTESIDIDDLSDSEMQSLDNALSAAFQEFRKARPVRKTPNKMPKDQTALMHFRLRCLDLIETLTNKDICIDLAVVTILPLLSLLETTVKEPLQKPLMNRTRTVLRKVTNIRRFADSSSTDVDGLVQLQQNLFMKAYAKKTLMPFINEDLVYCSSFVLRCILHIAREGKVKIANGKEPHVEMEGIFQLYSSELSKFFLKRDSPFPFGIFTRALQYPWPDAAFLFEPLTGYAFGASILNNRKMQALQLLAALFRNSTALSALGPLLSKHVKTILESTHKVLAEASKDSKPKYFNELFILLRVMYMTPETSKLTDAKELWRPVKDILPSFASRGVLKQKDLKKCYPLLAKVLKIDHKPQPLETVAAETKEVIENAGKVIAELANGTVEKSSTKKKSKKTFEGCQDRKEAKKRRMEAVAEGVDKISFASVPSDIAEVVEEEAPQKKKKKTQVAAEAEVVANGHEENAKSPKKKSKGPKAEAAAVEEATSDVSGKKKSAKKAKKINDSTVVADDSLINGVVDTEMDVVQVSTEKKAKKKRKS